MKKLWFHHPPSFKDQKVAQINQQPEVVLEVLENTSPLYSECNFVITLISSRNKSILGSKFLGWLF